MDELRPSLTYCERIDASFWAEPVNALTNLAFVIAAVVIANALVRDGQAVRKAWDLWLLAGLIAAIGVGSFLWHTLATPWSGLADVIPILLFINVYLVSFLARIVKPEAWSVAAGFVAFQIFNMIVLQAIPPGALNGSLFYVPTWAALWLMVAYCWRKGSAGRLGMARGRHKKAPHLSVQGQLSTRGGGRLFGYWAAGATGAAIGAP